MGLNRFEFDVKFFIEVNLATHLRKTKRMELYNELLSPFIHNHQKFKQKVTEVNRALSINFQTGLFEHLLNEEYEGNGSIKITNESFNASRVNLYYLDENEVNPNTQYLPILGERKQYGFYLDESLVQYDFIVKIPTTLINLNSALQSDIDKVFSIQAFLKKYRFAGKRYKLQNY